jgi:hypothetical protein
MLVGPNNAALERIKPQAIIRELFKELVAMDGVKGVLLFMPSGELVFKEFTIGGCQSVSCKEWFALVTSIGNTQEADLLFEKGRLYTRRTADGVMVVMMGLIAPCAMIRLNCDVLLRNLKAHPAPRGLRRFFRL